MELLSILPGAGFLVESYSKLEKIRTKDLKKKFLDQTSFTKVLEQTSE